MSSHSSIDVMQMSEEVSRLLTVSLEQKVPYYKTDKENDEAENKNKFDDYFKQLAAMQKEMAAAKDPKETISMKAEATDK